MKNKTILLVDDRPELLVTTSAVLQHAGYNVITANSRTSGIERYNEHKDSIDLIITDCDMHPCGTGFDLISDVRNLGGKQPIIMLSSNNGAEHEQTFSELTGDNETHTKPSNPRALLHQIAAMLKRQPATEMTQTRGL